MRDTLQRTRASCEEIPMKSFIKLCLVVATCAGTFAQNAPEQTSNAATRLPPLFMCPRMPGFMPFPLLRTES